MIDDLYLAQVIGRIDKKPVTSKQSSIEFVLVHFWKKSTKTYIRKFHFHSKTAKFNTTSIWNGETTNLHIKWWNTEKHTNKVYQQHRLSTKSGVTKNDPLKVLTDFNRPQPKTAVWIPNRFDINPDVSSTPDATSHTSKSMDGWMD